MKLSFAPLEGITTYTYRNAHNKIFGFCDEYYAPFITPSDNEKISNKTIRDILPRVNDGINLKVQLLTNNAVHFKKYAEKFIELGYNEININMGCPATRATGKKRGAGFLRDPEGMDRFFEEIFENTEVEISVKTRTGFHSGDEMEELMEIYNKYPLSQLIIHPRARADFYKGEPDMEVFKKAYEVSKNKICYNGNIIFVDDYNNITEKYSDLSGVMIGRGALRNPAMFREIKGGKSLETEELIKFTELLSDNYLTLLESETFTLYKLKEIWVYMLENYPECQKIGKALKKATKLTDFKNAIYSLPEI